MSSHCSLYAVIPYHALDAVIPYHGLDAVAASGDNRGMMNGTEGYE